MKNIRTMYKLALGQAGSSFTFEVALKTDSTTMIRDKIEKSAFQWLITIALKERSKMEKPIKH
jgi:DNA mismatch repair protein MutS2